MRPADAIAPLPPLPVLGKAEWVGAVFMRSKFAYQGSHSWAALANLARLVLLALERYRSAAAQIQGAPFVGRTFGISSDLESCILAIFRAWRLSNLITEQFRAPAFVSPSPDLNLQTLAEVRDLAMRFDSRLLERPRFPSDRINMPVPKERGITWGDFLIDAQALAETLVALWKHMTVVSDWAQQQTDWMHAEASGGASAQQAHDIVV